MRAEDPASITDPAARRFRFFADSVGADREALAAHAASRHRSRVALDKITAPTLVIAGDNDPFAARPEVLASSIANAQTLLLPGDHLGVVRAPGFAATIVEFLA